MTLGEYTKAVSEVLNKNSQEALRRFNKALALIPPKVRRITIDVFVDQDGEGFLSVRIGLEGPDLYVLNKAIESNADLFVTRMTQNGFEPPLPLMEPDAYDFSVHDALTDCAIFWVQSLWEQIDHDSVHLPVFLESTDEYGA